MSTTQAGQQARMAEISSAARSLIAQGRALEALVTLKSELEHFPHILDLQYLAAEAEFALGGVGPAITRLLAALQKTPSNNATLYQRLGDMLSSAGRPLEAQNAFRYAINLIPRSQAIPPQQLHIFLDATARADFDTMRLFGDMWEFFSALPANLIQAFLLRMFPYALSVEDNRRFLALSRRSNEETELAAKRNPLPGKPVIYNGGPIRIAFLSSLFSNNMVAKFFLPVFEIMNAMDDIEIWYFSTIEEFAGDIVQEKIRANVHAFINVSTLDPRKVAETIREHDCHVVIDMDGYAYWSKTNALNYRACGLQISWMNWPGTLGNRGIDAIVVDKFSAPDTRSLLGEETIVMQGPYYITGVLSEETVNFAPPCVQNGYITFGTQSAVYKYTTELIALWAEVLREVPTSHFLIVRPECGNPAFCENVLKEFDRNSIARGRIKLVDNKATDRNHMSFYNDMDIFLDSIPQTGGTTTMEAVWMGVPVVTYAGHNLHQRLSHAILCHLGLECLSGDNSSDYIENAVNLAQNPARIAELKRSLRDQIRSSGLFDAKAFTIEFIGLVKATLAKKQLAI